MGKTTDYPLNSLISFDALENPPWYTRTNGKQTKTVTEMITQIKEYHMRWEQARAEKTYSEKLIKKVQEQFLFEFIYHVNLEEGHGLTTLTETEVFLRNCRKSTSSLSLKEQETINLRVAYENLLAKINREERASDYGLMEVSLLEETHRQILQDIPLPKGFTKPGKMSNNPRVTEFKGELYHYANPEDMESAVSNVLDKYNFLFDSCTNGKEELNEFDDFYSLFKTCAWLLFELLDLHPFSDGNGRLCRILCSYALSKLNPFPTPIYNVWTDSSKHDYIEALVEARKSPDRHPCALTTMMIECSYYGWESFFKALNEEAKSQTMAEECVLSSTTEQSESPYKHSQVLPDRWCDPCTPMRETSKLCEQERQHKMAEESHLEGKREKLANHLPFDASESPKWRKKEEIPISGMITRIMDYHKQWEEAKIANLYSESLVERVQNQFLVKFIFHVNMEEEKGFGTFKETDEFLNSLFYARGGNLQLPFSHNQQETLNLRKAYEQLLTKVRREERENDYGLIESTLLKETHGMLMHGKPTHSEFSNEKRYNDYTEERYYYQQPVDMEKAVDKLLDKYNVMFELCTKDGLKEFDDFYYLFKTCAWLLFELLDLHPFRDGNGRLCRILCSYLLSKFTPFPTPVYNVWTDSSKTDYYEALVDAREQKLSKLCRHPTALTTMIIECSYYGWGKFFEALDGNKSS